MILLKMIVLKIKGYIAIKQNELVKVYGVIALYERIHV